MGKDGFPRVESPFQSDQISGLHVPILRLVGFVDQPLDLRDARHARKDGVLGSTPSKQPVEHSHVISQLIEIGQLLLMGCHHLFPRRIRRLVAATP